MGSARDESSSKKKYNSNWELLCYCKEVCPIRTSWTIDNPDRRLYGCRRFKGGGGGCNFFDWYEKPLPERVGQMLFAFREKKIRLTIENERLRRQLRNVGFKVDDGYSLGGSTSTGVVGNNVLDQDEATGKYGGLEPEEIEKIGVEVDLLKEDYRKLKLIACSNKKSKEIWRLCFFISCVLNGLILLYLRSNSNENGFLALP
ncbi:Zinc finger, GRF-type [Corchorus olitorius]|uniref:Zinc finger, GRF-type n=1 Tax=Corchorus olitorius TaxID=93759 RepID=A0A1R3GHK8_9ROSI|nr:Zinc finger, GRF-type [Corchorus olitorius]